MWVCGVLKLLSTRHLWNEDQNNLKICGIADRLTDGQKNKYMPNLVKIQCSENIFYDDDHLPRLQVRLVPCDNTDNRDAEWQLQGQTPGLLHLHFSVFPAVIPSTVTLPPCFCVCCSAEKLSIGSTTGFTITEKTPTRAFSWLKAPTSAFTFKTLLRHYAKRALTSR